MDAVEPRIRELLAECPVMPATVIAERIGWERSLRSEGPGAGVAAVVRAAGSGVADGVLTGEVAQCDLWFPPADIVGAGQAGRPPVLVMVAGYSRVISAVLLPSRQAPDLIAGHWALLSARCGAQALVWDNESAVGSWREGRPKLTEVMKAFRGMLACSHPVRAARSGVQGPGGTGQRLPRDVVSARPEVHSPADFNAQLETGWPGPTPVSTARGVSPADRSDTDRGAMLDLPPVAPAPGGG